MAKRIRKKPPEDHIGNFLHWLDQQTEENKLEHEEEQRRWVLHCCGHRCWYRRPWSEELRRELALAECPACQREWGKRPPASEKSSC